MSTSMPGGLPNVQGVFKSVDKHAGGSEVLTSMPGVFCMCKGSLKVSTSMLGVFRTCRGSLEVSTSIMGVVKKMAEDVPVIRKKN